MTDTVERCSLKCSLTDAELISKARMWVSRLSHSSGRAWSLQVPVNLEQDPDIIFLNLADRFEKLVGIMIPVSCEKSGARYRAFANMYEVRSEDWIGKEIVYKDGDLCEVVDVSTKGFVVHEGYETNVEEYHKLFVEYKTVDGFPVGLKVID